jgi:(5-formylfuran-3-yl)methyl phosphate synthase
VQLLVSVRSAAEVEPALAGGADIIDAKEPSRGSLGAVAPGTLVEILAQVPTQRPFSVALGDIQTDDQLLGAFVSLRVPKRPGPVFVKLGFAGLQSPPAVSRLLECAATAAAHHPCSPRLVAVAYADAERAGSLAPDVITQLAARAGAAGVLLDTHLKDGLGLFGSLSRGEVAAWISTGRRSGLLTAVAGEIGPADLERVQGLEPDVVGVRGAACDRGRGGTVSAERVMSLRRCLPPARPVFHG